MKPQLTLTLVLTLLCLSLGAQVKFKVKLLTDNQTFQVLFRPDVTFAPPLNTVSGAQVTLRVPAGGFTVNNLTSLKGTWSNNATVKSPPENPGYDYIVFGLQNPTSAIPLNNGEEVAVFQFKNSGACTGPMELIENESDPFWPPNSQNVNIGNSITVVGAGFGNAYTGNYNAISADCKPSSNCDAGIAIEVFDVILKSPSGCGIADGRIEIVATINQPLQLQYTINGGITWQNSPIFTGLAAGDLFDLRVRDEIPICIVNIGKFELDGPLAAVITGIDTDDPDCGASNGSITIHGHSENGNTLNFSIDNKATWQLSNTFTGLPAGVYPAWVRDIVNNCENFITMIVLNDCPPPPPCIVHFELVYMGSGRYQVQMIPDTTYTFPDNITSSMQVTVKVPTGGFDISNLTSQLTGVDWSISSIYTAPPEDPAHDYITFGMTSPGTQNIPYSKGATTPLFTFENVGDCTGGFVSLMPNDDPFYPPNSQNAAVGQQLTVFGYGGADAPVCIAGSNAEPCEPVDPPAPSCLITYELEKLPNGLFQISFTPDTTWTFPANITSSAQYTVKVPSGGFVPGNVTSMVSGVLFEIASTYTAPTEDPAHDYISFILGSPGTQSIPYQKGVKTPLFTFENIGTCEGGSVFLMDNETDPFFPPNSQNAAVGQQLTVFGYGGADAPICVVNNPADDCGGCTGLAASFTANDACTKDTVYFNDQTTSTETIVSWNWDFGDGSAPSNLQHPSHVYSTSGNFEVSLTVTTEGGCLATFTDSVTVFSSPGDAPQDFFGICSGEGVTLQSPPGVSAVWSPATGLDNPTSTSPFASPSSTTIYTVTFTSPGGCTSQDQVTVEVASKPVISNLLLTADCDGQGGTITILAASASGCVQYSIDNGATWQQSNTFASLPDGAYIILVRNCTGSCPVAWNGNPVSLTTPAAPSIDSVDAVSPTTCGASNGSLTIHASSGIAPLQYRINGGAYQASNTFTNLAGGTYLIEVANADLSCFKTTQATLSDPTPPTVLTPVNDFSLCAGNTASVSIQISQTIQSFNIGGNGIFSGASFNGNTLTFDVHTSPGTSNYSVVLTAQNGCTTTETFSLTQLTIPTVAFTASTPSCTNGNVTLNFTGTAGPLATYTWSLDGGTVVFPGNTTRVVSWSTPGLKNVTLTVNDQGCSSSLSQLINISNFDPIATLDVTPISGCGGSNGAINLTLSGSGSYSFNWSGPGGFTASTQNLSGLAAGTYTVTITETGSLCSASTSQQLTAPPAVNIAAIIPNPASDCTGNAIDGSILVQISGGTPAYQFNLYKTDNLLVPIQTLNLSLTSATFTGLPAGAYQVEVIDVNGCSDVTIATVTANGSPLSVSAGNIQQAGCGVSNGSFRVTASGSPPFDYVLYKNAIQTATGSFSNSSLDFNNLGAGTYTVVVVDATGCVALAMALIESTPANFGVTASVSHPSCGSNDGSITLSNLPPGATFTWTSTSGNPLPPSSTLTGLPIGVYMVVITNGNGCSEGYSFVLQPSDGGQVNISQLVNATCGNGGNGSVTFTVTNANAFSYQILNSPHSGFANPNTPLTVTGLSAGAYLIAIEDLVTGCKAFEPFVIGGGLAQFTVIAVASPPSNCGVADAAVCLNISGGTSPYTITSNVGNFPSTPVAGQGCIQGLYEGQVLTTITDANGCSLTLSVELDDQPDVSLSPADVAISHNFCPGGLLGKIESVSGYEYEVFNQNNAFVGITPLSALPAGLYKIRHKVGECIATLDVEVDGVPDWSITYTTIPESCDGNDGAILLSVSGANGDYTYQWSNNGVGSSLTGLNAATSYSVTISDSQGCSTTLENILVADDCPVQPCEAVFYVDTFYVLPLPGLTEVCLPTKLSDLAPYALTLDGAAYTHPIDQCSDSTIFYGYGILLTLGQPPYRLESWTYGGNTASSFEFTEMAQLVARMNDLDPAGNWVLDASESSISGGQVNKNYGSLILTHIATSTTLTLQVNTVSVPHPSIFVAGNQGHTFIVENAGGCKDTLHINLLQIAQPTKSTITVTVPVGGSQVVCLDTNELYGTPEFLSNACVSITNNALIINHGTECFTVEGLQEGPDEACMILCDNKGICDTTIVKIEVVDTSTQLIIYNGFSPNNDGSNEYFRIKNIELYPNNDLIIFNRWGNSVYQTTSYTNANPWRGFYRGAALPDGSYFYILNVEIHGKKETFKGFVELRR